MEERESRHQSANKRAADRPGRGPETGRRSRLQQHSESRPPQSERRRPPKRSGRRQSKRRRRRNIIVHTGLMIFLVCAAIVGYFLWNRYSPTQETYDLKKYYGIENEDQVAVVVNDQIVETKGKLEEGHLYVQYETVRDHINGRFYWDANENVLLYTLPNDVVSVAVGSKDYYVSKEKNSADYAILKTEGSTAYIALDFIEKYTNMTAEVYKNPNRAVITTSWRQKAAAAKRDAAVRYRGGVKSPILTKVKKADPLVIIDSEKNWNKVRTPDGVIGYIQKNRLKAAAKQTAPQNYEEPDYTNITKDYTINLAWHNVTNATANNKLLATIANTKGLTTIAPTWFHVKDTAGNLESIASAQYVNYCHQSNIEVWATLRDFDGGINSQEETLALLSHTSQREKLINNLISTAMQTGLDGINLDFEKISKDCADHYIQFVRELSVKCRQNGLVFSVDNYVPKNYNSHYNRKEQGVFADYVVIMGYDEHWSGSPAAGSVASYDFVREGIEETLKEVPAQKVISGVPFFTRLWEEVPKSADELAKEAGTEAAEYPNKVTSTALGMNAAAEAVAESGAKTTWDEKTRQNYATWTNGDKTYQIWLEDEKSLEEKLKLMKEHKLAGTAAWALGQEKADIWNLIIKYVN